MKTLKFSYLSDTVGVKVPDKADFALALNKAFTALDLEYSELWDVLDEGGNVVELSTKVKLFRDGTKFAIKAQPPTEAEIAACKTELDEPEPAPPTPAAPVFEPAKAPTVLGAAKVAGAAQEVGLLAIAPPPPVMMPPMSITPSQAMVQPTPPITAAMPSPPSKIGARYQTRRSTSLARSKAAARCRPPSTSTRVGSMVGSINRIVTVRHGKNRQRKTDRRCSRGRG